MGGEVGLVCGYSDQHPRIDSELRDHERRIDTLEREGRQDRKDLWVALGRVEKGLENLKGWAAGVMIAAGLLGGIVGFVAIKVVK